MSAGDHNDLYRTREAYLESSGAYRDRSGRLHGKTAAAHSILNKAGVVGDTHQYGINSASGLTIEQTLDKHIKDTFAETVESEPLLSTAIPKLKDKNLQNIVNDLSPEEREKILQGVPASNLISSEEREVIAQKLARSQSSTGRRGAFKKFDSIAKTQIEKIPVSKSPMTTGAELTMAQTENANLKAEAATESGAPVIAPSTINNSKSSVSNVTVAAPPHIDKTQVLFSTPNLAW
jgi:hypothetical protein